MSPELHGPGSHGRSSLHPRTNLSSVQSKHFVAAMWDAADTVHFVDSEGTPWRVTEHNTAETPGALADACLIFLSEGIARRSWRVPPNWRDLPAPALERLMLARA